MEKNHKFMDLGFLKTYDELFTFNSDNSSFKSEVTLTLIVTSMNDITSLKSYFIFGSTAQSDLQYNALSVKQQCTKKPNKNSFDANQSSMFQVLTLSGLILQ